MLWNSKSSNTKTTRETGESWERYAEEYLSDMGLQSITRNFHCRLGELDLIMKEESTFVFVEVKYRKNSQFGGAISAITPSKQKKLIKTAYFYLQQQGLSEYNTSCRFDVVTLEGDSNHPQINWIKNAF